MDYIKEKVAYLKGLTEGLGLDDTTSEGKVLLHIVEILDDMADALEGLADAQEELEEDVYKRQVQSIFGDAQMVS